MDARQMAARAGELHGKVVRQLMSDRVNRHDPRALIEYGARKLGQQAPHGANDQRVLTQLVAAIGTGDPGKKELEAVRALRDASRDQVSPGVLAALEVALDSITTYPELRREGGRGNTPLGGGDPGQMSTFGKPPGPGEGYKVVLADVGGAVVGIVIGGMIGATFGAPEVGALVGAVVLGGLDSYAASQGNAGP